MLDNLRAMGVFACVVECGSFSGGAKRLGITTSAVSQQIRSLEIEMNVVLLHRSTRKISMTEAGQAFYHSCQEMMAAAEKGRIRISELQDDLVGDLRIATTPLLGVYHVVPALSRWIDAHSNLNFSIDADYNYIDLVSERIDIAIRLATSINEDNVDVFPLAKVDQVLIASADYLHQHAPIKTPEDLLNHQLIPVQLGHNTSKLVFKHSTSNTEMTIKMPAKVKTNNVYVMKTLCEHGHGIGRILNLDVQKELLGGDLVQVLPEWKLPEYTLYAIVLKREKQPMKIERCLEVLKKHFSKLNPVVNEDTIA